MTSKANFKTLNVNLKQNTKLPFELANKNVVYNVQGTTGVDKIVIKPETLSSKFNLKQGNDQISFPKPLDAYKIMAKNKESIDIVDKVTNQKFTFSIDNKGADTLFFKDGHLALGLEKNKVKFGDQTLNNKFLDLKNVMDKIGLIHDNSTGSNGSTTPTNGNTGSTTPTDTKPATNPNASTQKVVVLDGQGTSSAKTVIDAGTGSFNFTDDAKTANNVSIKNFGADDAITVLNGKSSDYTFSTANNNVDISFNNNGVLNSIEITGVSSGFASGETSFNKLAIGDIYFQ